MRSLEVGLCTLPKFTVDTKVKGDIAHTQMQYGVEFMVDGDVPNIQVEH
jgi:hypothetical protein